jgi:hypothetical protein
VVSALVVGAILAYLVWREREALQSLDLRLAWPALLIGVTIMTVGLVMAAANWAGIMRGLGSRVAALRHMNIYATTYLQRHLPGTVWYVLGRGVLYRDEGEPARLVTMASAVELMLTIMAGAVTSLALLFTVGSRLVDGALPAALVAVTVAGLAGAALLHPATLRWVTRRLKLPETPRLSVRAMAGWLTIYAVNCLIGGLIVYLNARALLGAEGEALPLGYILFAWCLVITLAVVVFFLPSNFGFTEIGLSLLLSAVMPSSVAVLVAILTRVLLIVYGALGCLAIAAVTSRLLRRTPRPT